jgi:quinol-cytochrome oxidoreductase complex cytochrome b subunit
VSTPREAGVPRGGTPERDDLGGAGTGEERDAPAPRADSAPRRDLLGWLEERLNLTEIFSFLTHFGLVFTPVDARRPLRDVVREIARQPAPSYARGPRVLGLLAAILFGLEVVTGVLLAYYYQPTSATAFESTRTIVRDLPFGWLLHQIHAWGAWLLVGIVVVRLLRLFWDGLYGAPRELLWIFAVAMAWVALQLDFTGRLLTWDTHSYWSAVRGMEVVFALPIVGPGLAFLLGGREMNDDVLIRFYVLHVIVLPLFYTGLLYLTFATIRRVGLSPEPARTGGATGTFGDHMYAMSVLIVLAFAVLVTLGVLLPFPFHAAADPYATPVGVRPPWYMLAPYAALNALPGPRWAIGGALVLAAFAVALLPLLLRGRPDEAVRGRARLLGLVALAAWLGLSVLALRLDR